MFCSSGKHVPVSPFRRLVIDLMHFTAQVPSATVERRMGLGRLVAARKGCTPPPAWSAIFTRAYALVAARTPLLRTCYLGFPWPRFYEHGTNAATLYVDRQLADERIVLTAQMCSPECCTLQELDAAIRQHQAEPPETLPCYRRAARLSRVPWPFRRLLWWGALNVLGPVRSHFFGTFALTSLGSQGAGVTYVAPLLTSQIHYGTFDAAGSVEMRLSFDHRVLDGATAAGALADMEGVLLSEITQECRESMRSEAVAASECVYATDVV
jgi:hypothetical protein